MNLDKAIEIAEALRDKKQIFGYYAKNKNGWLFKPEVREALATLINQAKLSDGEKGPESCPRCPDG